MKISTFKTGSDGRTRPLEDRPIKPGSMYLAKILPGDAYRWFKCIEISGFLYFIEPEYPNFKVHSTYFSDVVIPGEFKPLEPPTEQM